MNKPLFIAHRGGGKGVYENRIEKIKKTLENPNIDAIEIDLRKTKDHVLVLHHNRGVRLNGERVWVDEVNYDQIKHLGIPTLNELLPLFSRSDKILDIDVKEEEIIPHLAQELKEKRFDKKLFISCHNLQVLMDLQENLPNGEYYLSLNPKDSRDLHRRLVIRVLGILITVFFSQLIIYFLRKRVNKKMKLDGISIYHRFAKKNFIRDLKDFGFKVFVWGTDKEGDIKRLTKYDIDGIKTRNTKSFDGLSTSDLS